MSASIKIPRLTDYQLIQKVVQHDKDAFDQIYERHNMYLRSACLHFVRNPDIVEDVIQETWQVIWQRANTFRGESHFRTWAYRVMKNQFLMLYRREKARPEGRKTDDTAPIVIASGSSNYRNMSVVSKIGLQKALEQLPPGYRVVFCLKAGMGYEHEEIGELLGVNAGTSKSQYFKARKALIDLYEKGCRTSVSLN